MFVRITVNATHRDSRKPLGILQAVRWLRDAKELTASEFAKADSVFRWLSLHLSAPSKQMLRSNRTAVSWFRAEAREHIRKVERLIPIVQAHGFVASRTASRNPGEVIYADAFQVIAKARPSTQDGPANRSQPIRARQIERQWRLAPIADRCR